MEGGLRAKDLAGLTRGRGKGFTTIAIVRCISWLAHAIAKLITASTRLPWLSLYHSIACLFATCDLDNAPYGLILLVSKTTTRRNFGAAPASSTCSFQNAGSHLNLMIILANES